MLRFNLLLIYTAVGLNTPILRLSTKLNTTAHSALPLAENPEFCMIQRHAGEERNHDLGVSDAFRINRGIKEVAARQMSIG